MVGKAKIIDKMFWWLSKSRPFYIGDEYMIELSEIDFKHGTAKINITNLKAPKGEESDE